MVGSAILRQLRKEDQHDVLTATRGQLDLTDQAAVNAFLRAQRPDAIILAAARVGGIMANNSYPADFIYDNTMIATNVIHQAHLADVQSLLFLGSSCIYPRDTAQPIDETALLTGQLEPTNEPYALAKIAGIKMCESYNRQYGRDYRCLMPTNLYGPGDNFHPQNAHVLPALLSRFHAAVETGAQDVTIWGTGTPRREFLHVDDMAKATLFAMGLPTTIFHALGSHINVGTGQDISIADLAKMVAQVTGFAGGIRFDTSKPDGTPRKLLNVDKIRQLGWQAHITLHEGIKQTYDWFIAQTGANAIIREA